MKIAIATKDWRTVSGHAGQARCWLIYDLAPGLERGALPAPERVELAKEQVLHHFRDEGPHPLDGVEVVVAGSAGDGFVRHMQKRGAQVLLTGETEPSAALPAFSPEKPCRISASTSQPRSASCAICSRGTDAEG